ncbi:MAG: hypothetical protein M1832_002401 [Thelocarpon impressellum]|nr:MAG: hypothetical protein M1832_002401 [Thelocarpon impressellum]
MAEPAKNPTPQQHQPLKLGETGEANVRYKLVFFAPKAPLEAIKEALFSVGAGSHPGGKYTHCCFQTEGLGQFLPEGGRGADPHIGVPGTLEKVEEVRVEMLCVGRALMRQAVEELKRAHPYEDPACEVYRMEDV